VNLNRKIDNRIILVVLLAAAAGGALVFGGRTLRTGGQAAAEVKAQEPEIDACKKQLKTIYEAWNRYRGDHKGQDPPTVEALFPKYLTDTSILICPTAHRWENQKVELAQGLLLIDGKRYPESYGFKWLSAGFPKMVKKYGEKVPLIVCDVHQTAMYIAAYRKKPKPDALDSDKIGSLISEVKSSPTLAVRRNGTVEALSSDEPR
jgi:hypothetical protein